MSPGEVEVEEVKEEEQVSFHGHGLQASPVSVVRK